MMKRTDRGWLCLPALVLCCCDVSITLASQCHAFWAGAFGTAEEGNPLALVFLLLGPWVFVAATIVWALVFSAVILIGHRSLALALSFGLTIGHALGTAFWLPRHGLVGFAAAIIVLVAARQILNWSWAKADVRLDSVADAASVGFL